MHWELYDNRRPTGTVLQKRRPAKLIAQSQNNSATKRQAAEQSVIAIPKPPKPTVHVHAISPERDCLEIKFPRVEGYRTHLPNQILNANFSNDSFFELTPDLVSPSTTTSGGIIGGDTTISLDHLKTKRQQEIEYELTKFILNTYFIDDDGHPILFLFPQLKRVVRKWFNEEFLKCTDGTFPAQILLGEIPSLACERIVAGISSAYADPCNLKPILDPYYPIGSTKSVNFVSKAEIKWKTDPDKSHINWVICDNTWELDFCRVLENHPRVLSYAKNHGLGFEVPYSHAGERRKYVPDFLVKLRNGNAGHLNLIVEINSVRKEADKAKSRTMNVNWIPAINFCKKYGRWDFVELDSARKLTEEFEQRIYGILSDAEEPGKAGIIRAGGSQPDIEDIPRRRSTLFS